MASGKKGKRNKGKTLALTDFLQETPGPVTTLPIRKSALNWADEVEDSYDGYESRSKVNVVLPTAPKASRDYEDVNEKVPKEPPYIAYLSNLPYDVDEEEIALFFKNMKIANMRIPKDERPGEPPKLKGFGYVEFEDRDSLLNALVIPDTTLKSRRIRIEVSTNSDNDRRRGRMDMGRDRSDRGESSFGDWRSGPRADNADSDRGERKGFSRENRDRDGGGFMSRDNRDRGEITRDNKDRDFSRDNRDRDYKDKEFSRDNREFNRDNRDREFNRDNRDRDDDRPGGWRNGDRPFRDSDRNPPRNDRYSDRGGRYDDGREGGERDRRGFGGRRFDGDRDERNGGYSRSSNREDPEKLEPRQRPKLVLAPRTKPVESSQPVATKPPAPAVPAASIFGSAKPVDTSAREREIEEKLAKDKEHDTVERRPPSTDGRESRDDNRRQAERERFSKRSDESPNKDRDLRDNRDSRDIRDYKDRVSPQGYPTKRDDEKKLPPRGDSRANESEKSKSEKPRKEEKRDRPEKEMPKMKEIEPPNFAASNKFAFLQDEENSD